MKRVLLYGEGAKYGTGISRYVQAIARGIQNSEANFEYTVAIRGFHTIPNFNQWGVIYRTNGLKGKLQDLVRSLPIGDDLLFGRSDIVHEPNYRLCRVGSSTKIILTVHDVGWRVDSTPYGLTREFIQSAEAAIHQSSKIITPSETVKNDVIRFFHYPPDDIHVIYHGIESIFATNEVHVLQRVLPEQYWLFVGTPLTRKNIERIILALASMCEKLPLIIAGASTPYAEKLVKDAAGLGVQVIIISGTTDIELKELYRNSKGLVYPSLWEGFGLPIIEAAAVGTAVITSNNTSMKEIANKDCLLVNPASVKEITMALQAVLDLDNAAREERIARNKEMAKSYTWDKSIAAHKRLYEMM